MNKTEFVDKLSEKTGLSKVDAKNALEATMDIITDALVSREDISLTGFATFTTAEREARTAKVPGTDRTVEVPATVVAKVKIGKTLKEAVAAGK